MNERNESLLSQHFEAARPTSEAPLLAATPLHTLAWEFLLFFAVPIGGVGIILWRLAQDAKKHKAKH